MRRMVRRVIVDTALMAVVRPKNNNAKIYGEKVRNASISFLAEKKSLNFSCFHIFIRKLNKYFVS